jgi:regulator of sigma E protease
MVERAGKLEKLVIPDSLIGMLVEKKKAKSTLFMYRMPPIIGEFDKKDTISNAKKAGLQSWDKIVKVDSADITFLDEASSYFGKRKNGKVMLTVNRKGTMLQLPVNINEDGKILPAYLLPMEYDSLGFIKIEHTDYSFFGSFPAGVKLAFTSLADYYQQFKLMLTPSTGTYKAMGGFKGMGNAFDGDEWDWHSFWLLTAFFSIALAFMNLLPIPALDGGHVVFTLYEMITGRKPNEKFLEYAQIVGMVILLALMLFANGNDWFGYGRGK